MTSNEGNGTRCVNKGGVMKYATKTGSQRSEIRRSNRSAINPYLIEDVAMTRGELERARVAGPTMTVAR
jgi:hypothetical protein